MDVNDKRRLNIKYLADIKYGRIALAEMLGYQDANYLNQLCGGFGNFGTRTARKIESCLSLPHGWMDNSHPELYEPGDQSKEELIAALNPAQKDLLVAYLKAPDELQAGIRRLLNVPESE